MALVRVDIIKGKTGDLPEIKRIRLEMKYLKKII